ncbi:hypothetical protein J2847_002950 [Azospirillum agricola]|uniref:hypothetical protein n=1 Tax=Azospirillum agricola TaxID=1720247 RepID=UPI001AE8CBAF|nr:hypothetical protein [Azospirillum agricola]MBP2229651.1 hypothetical protein [Azospirillum agricola]
MAERTTRQATAPAKPVPVPAAVEANGRARAVWAEMVETLGSRLTPLNLPILTAHSLAVARLEDAQTKLGSVGPLVKRKDQAEVNPLLDVVERELRIVLDTAKALDAASTPWKRK